MKPKQIFIALGMILQTYSTIGQIKPDDLNKIIEQSRTKFGLPAIGVTILNSEGVLQTELQGVRVHGENTSVSLDDYFHIGSCAKSVLAVIAARLVEEDKIKWSTKFFDLYPELNLIAFADYHHITLEDLLLCKAGIKEGTSGIELPELDKNSKNIRYDFAKWLVQQKPVSKNINGSFDFHYSNGAYSMASLMLEKVSGKSYKELIDQYIVNELDIDTYVGFPNLFSSEQPWGHVVNKAGIKIFPPDHNYSIPDYIFPAGDLSMKPRGFAKFIQLNLSGLTGSNNFIKSGSYKYIHYANKGFSMGFLNSRMYGLDFTGMDGSAGSFFCRAILIPGSDFAFTIMTNAGTGTAEMKAVDWIAVKIVKKYYNWWWKFWIY